MSASAVCSPSFSSTNPLKLLRSRSRGRTSAAGGRGNNESSSSDVRGRSDEGGRRRGDNEVAPLSSSAHEQVIEGWERLWMLGIQNGKAQKKTVAPSACTHSTSCTSNAQAQQFPSAHSCTKQHQSAAQHGSKPWPTASFHSFWTSTHLHPSTLTHATTEPTPIPGSPSSHHSIPTKRILATQTAHRCSTDAEGTNKPSRGEEGSHLNSAHIAANAVHKTPSDFASVFFSPLPFSYLNAAQSKSADHLLANSNSPDVTLRGGRLTVGTSLAHDDWPVDVDLASPSCHHHPLSSSAQAQGGGLQHEDSRHHGNHAQILKAVGQMGKGLRSSRLSGGNLSRAYRDGLSPGMQGTLLAQAESACSPHTQGLLHAHLGTTPCSGPGPHGLLHEAETAASLSARETLLAEATAAEAAAVPALLVQDQALKGDRLAELGEEEQHTLEHGIEHSHALQSPHLYGFHYQQYQQQQQHDNQCLQQLHRLTRASSGTTQHKPSYSTLSSKAAPLHLPLEALQGAQRNHLPTTPISGPLQEDAASHSSQDSPSSTSSALDAPKADEKQQTRTTSSPFDTPSGPPTLDPSVPAHLSRPTPSCSRFSTHTDRAPRDSSSSTASDGSEGHEDDGHHACPTSNGTPLSSSDATHTGGEVACGECARSAPTSSSLPQPLFFPEPARLSISSCASCPTTQLHPTAANAQPPPTRAPSFNPSTLPHQQHPKAGKSPLSSDASSAPSCSSKCISNSSLPFPAQPAAGLVHPSGPMPAGTDFVQARGSTSAIALAVQRARKNPQLTAIRLIAGAAMIPHVDKADKGGEDAFCICNAGLGSIGVADGVSGWAVEGIDPAEYSRTLMRHCKLALEAAGTEAQGREIIRHAHQQTVMAGSSTACLAVMKSEGRLEVVNIGDSGVRVIREGVIFFASAAQQHMFNMPFQLSHPSIIESPDDADSACASIVDVQPGDVIVLATDGLYDNMFDEEIARLCGDYMNRRRKSMQIVGGSVVPPTAAELAAATVAQARQQQFTGAEAEFLAQEIARLAHCYAHDPCRRTPWSVASCEQGFSWAHYFADGGGKMDDCTVVVAFVQSENANGACMYVCASVRRRVCVYVYACQVCACPEMYLI